MRFAFIAIVAASLHAHRAEAQLTGLPDANPLGTWRGTSSCVERPSGCADQDIVYRITRTASADTLAVGLGRMRDGREDAAGSLTCAIDAARGFITCSVAEGRWRFAARHDSLFGQLRLRDGTLIRQVHATRSPKASLGGY
jgi:hypothetical protein